MLQRFSLTLDGRRARACLWTLLLLLLAGWWAGTATKSGAQGPQIDVVEVRAIQVIHDAPLVAGKATVVRVDLNAGGQAQATVEVTLDAGTHSTNVRIAQGWNTFFVPVNPPTRPGTVNLSARVVVGGAAGPALTRQVEVVQLRRDRMNVLFMPVDWTTQERNRGFTPNYDNFAAATGDFFRATYPFPAGNMRIEATKSVFMLTPAQRAIVDARGDLDWAAIVDMYSSIVVAGRRVMPDADLVVGVLPPKWFARNLKEPNVVGLELQAVQSAVTTQVDADYATLAHETGHIFGRGDDYDFGLQPPKFGNRIDTPGYWVAKNRQIDPEGSTPYYAFMGAQTRGSEYWVDRDTYITILRMLQDGFAPWE